MLTKMSGLGLVLCTLQVSFSGVCISVAVRFSSRGYSTIYFTLMGKKCCFLDLFSIRLLMVSMVGCCSYY